MRPIRNSLWFDGNAHEAATFYCSVFPDAAITDVQRYTEAGPGEPGTVVTVAWRIGSIGFVGINGGPMYTFTPAISFVAECEDQAEVDRLWSALIAGGGSPGQCGWLKDRFGLSWQIVPRQLGEMMSDPDRERAGWAMAALLRMSKIEVDDLRRAFEGEPVG